MKGNQTSKNKSIVMTAFFAAIVFLGIQIFRIPMPAAVGTPFLHFGHIFVVLSILCMGGKRAAISGTLGLVIFDILNGYFHAIPNVFCSTIIKCLTAGAVFSLLNKRAGGDRKKEYQAAMIVTILYGILNIVTDFAWNTAELVLLGSSLPAALIAEAASIPATIINAIFAVIGIAVLYVPVSAAYKQIVNEPAA